MIVAESEWGVLRGLETLVQINEVVNDAIGIYDQEITDEPSYRYRGLLVDTSHHFISISVLKSLITALSDGFKIKKWNFSLVQGADDLKIETRHTVGIK